MQLSTSLASMDTMSMAQAFSGIDLGNVTFVQYPVGEDPEQSNKVVPLIGPATELFDKILADEPFAIAEDATGSSSVEVPAEPTEPPTPTVAPSPERRTISHRSSRATRGRRHPRAAREHGRAGDLRACRPGNNSRPLSTKCLPRATRINANPPLCSDLDYRDSASTCWWPGSFPARPTRPYDQHKAYEQEQKDRTVAEPIFPNQVRIRATEIAG